MYSVDWMLSNKDVCIRYSQNYNNIDFHFVLNNFKDENNKTV